MSEKTIWIALADDWELRGNGTGDVEALQHNTAVKLMDCYDALGVTASFNVEVMQQMAFERYEQQYDDIARQAGFWRKAVEQMAERGFDIQLHLHPQWHNAEYDGKNWRLDRRWDITAYTPEQIERFVSEGVTFLARYVSRDRICSFRAGSWGIGPPSRSIVQALIRHGIKTEISIVNGIFFDGDCITLDYTSLECPYEPYYPDVDDARKIAGQPTGLVEIPTQSVAMASVLGAEYPLYRLKQTLKPLVRQVRGIVANVHRRVAGGASFRAELPPNPFGVGCQSDFICDFASRQPLRHWLRAVDIVIERARRMTPPAFIVFENHTKDLTEPRDFERIEAIIRHIQQKYGDQVAFVQLREMVRSLDLIEPKRMGSHDVHSR